MADRNARDQLAKARRALVQLEQKRQQQIHQLAETQRTLRQLQRHTSPDDERLRVAEAAHSELLRNLEAVRGDTRHAKHSVRERLATWLPDTVEQEWAALAADVPALLLPVRIETRFGDSDQGAPVLRVRVYPDALFVDSHDPALTVAERDAGIAYWQEVWSGIAEEHVWRDLTARFGAPRAAWITRASQPVNRGGNDPDPVFPEIELRAAAWTRAPRAALLPDRWLVVGYRQAQEVVRVTGRAIPDGLAFGFDPHGDPSAVRVVGEALELDEDLAWTVDFAQATEVGMAVTVPLDAADVQHGFDRLCVIGVRASLGPGEAAAAVEQLFDAHHYSGGWAFVPQGAPTNNTEAAGSAYPMADPDGRTSFDVERGPLPPQHGGDGHAWARAVGVEAGIVTRIGGANGREQELAAAMSTALSPTTFGYFLRQMMAPHISPEHIESARNYAAQSVRGRGPLPAFRVGGQPYGILPMSSLARWTHGRADSAIERHVSKLAQTLWPHWLDAARAVPHVGTSDDPDADLVAILGLHPSSEHVHVRTAHGPDMQANLLSVLGLDVATWEEGRRRGADDVMELLGVPKWHPRILEVTFGNDAGRYRHPLVARHRSETQLLTPNYIRWIRTASIDDLRDEAWPEDMGTPNALLYRVLRHARLLEVSDAALDLFVAHGKATTTELAEQELVGVTRATRDRPTRWSRLTQPIAEVSGDTPIGDFLTRDQDRPESLPVRTLDQALGKLEGVSTSELQRLFTETLDLSSHRLDPWVTSLATHRLEDMRSRVPRGVHVGGYGWVENLRPRSAALSHGFIHAPSLDHAATAAVLRSGHLARGGDQDPRYSVDLSSAQVREALEILDTTRDGLPLAAVLGARFERTLRDSDRSVMHFAAPLRSRFPLTTGAARGASNPSDRAVVNGITMRAAFVAGTLDLTHADFATGDAARDEANIRTVVREIRRLDTSMDAVADLLLAESVYQSVAGNPSSAAATLDTIARGRAAPDPAIAQSPRAGIPVAHRVAIVLHDAPTPLPGWPTEPTPRARAEPWLDAWIGRRLGDPRRVRARVYPAATGADDAAPDHTVTLAELGLRPIDVLHLAAPTEAQGHPTSELDLRIAGAVSEQIRPDTVVVDYTRAASWGPDVVGFPELLELCRHVRALLGASRALMPGDLVPPSEAAGVAVGQGPELAERARRAVIELEQTREQLADARGDQAATRRALRAASNIIEGAYPTGSPTTEFAESVMDELRRRHAVATSTTAATDALRGVFGDQFPVLPRFSLPGAQEFGRALAASDVLVGAPDAAALWLAQTALVKPPLHSLRVATTLAETLGAASLSITVAQLPVREGDRWIALDHVPGEPPHAGSLGLVLVSEQRPLVHGQWAGLVVEEFTDVIPDARPTTGLTFHFDTPGNEAPQCVLLAVPPRPDSHWELDDVLAILGETADLARVRAVDATQLGQLGRILPASYLAANAANDTVSTRFATDLATDAAIAKADPEP